MEAVQLLQLNSNSQTLKNRTEQTVKNSKQGENFLEKLNDAAVEQKKEQQTDQSLNKNEVDSVEDLTQDLSQEEIEKVKKLLSEDADSNLNLNSTELKKLKKLLAEDGFELTEEELKELLDSIGSIYQQLMELDINQLSSLSEAEKAELKKLKADLLTTVKEFKLQLKNLKELDTKKLELLQQLKSDQQKSIKDQQKLKAAKQLKENLLQKLAELKKLAGKMQKQKSTFGLKGNQQNQQLQQISKLLKQLTNSDNKLSKLLQKYGITGEQIEVETKKQQAKVKNQQSSDGKTAKDNAASNQKLKGKEESKSQNSSDKSSLKQLLESQDKESKDKKVKVRLSSDKQKLKAESFNAAKASAEDQMKVKNNVARQNIVNSKFMNVSGNLQRVDQTKVVNQVLQQLEQLKSLGKNELTLKLKPDSLGKVNLKMAISDGVLTTKVMAENYQVKKAIEAQLHQLKNALTEKNLEVGEMVVEVGSEEDFSSFQEQESFNQQDFSGQQQNGQNQQELDPELLMELGEIEEPIEVDSAVDSSLEVDSIDYVI